MHLKQFSVTSAMALITWQRTVGSQIDVESLKYIASNIVDSATYCRTVQEMTKGKRHQHWSLPQATIKLGAPRNYYGLIEVHIVEKIESSPHDQLHG